MPHYKDTNNHLHYIEREFAHLLPAGSVEISDAEADQIREQNQPALVIPSVVSIRQARLALLQAGLLATVDAAVAAGGDADKITWEYATEVDRNSPLVTNMALALNLSAQDLDNLFTLAASL